MARVCKRGGKVLLQDLDGKLLWHYPEDAVVQNTAETVVKALEATGFDPFVGRKLFWLPRNAGLKNVEVPVERYHLIAWGVEPAMLQESVRNLELAKHALARS